MARFQIKRHFPSSQVLRVGQIVTDPQWRNLTHLLNQGYVKEVPDETEITPVDEVTDLKIPADIVDLEDRSEVAAPAKRKTKRKPAKEKK